MTYENVEDIIKLHSAEKQMDFVESNDWSLIESYLSLIDGKLVFSFGIYHIGKD